MATMLTEQFANLIIPAMRALFIAEIEQTPDIVGQLFNVQTSANAYEKMVGVSGLGLIQQKVEGAPAQFGMMSQEYLTTFTHIPYSQTVPITRELLDDQNFLQINSIAMGLGSAYARTRQSHGASVFNNAFSSSYLQGDGKALCATDHPRGASDATAISNKGTSALSHSALSAARIAMRKFVDPKGNPMGVMGDTLIVPPDLEITALEIVQSTQKSGTANNDANVLSNTRVIVWDWLTDTNNWFLVDSRLAKRNLYWFDRVAPEMQDEYEQRTATLYVTGYGRWSYSPIDWRWIYGSEVA